LEFICDQDCAAEGAIGCSPYGAGWHVELYYIAMQAKLPRTGNIDCAASAVESVRRAKLDVHAVGKSLPNWPVPQSKVAYSYK
jgi:hypothetical protein